jgi:type IV pilus assembly protein PilC
MSARRAAISKARTQAESRRLNPMVEFVWQGRDKRGVKMKGEQTAKNANLLRAELRKQGITPTVVKPKPKPLFGGSGTKITSRDIAIFSRQLATMMKSGVPMVMSMEIIAGGSKNPAMKKLVEQRQAGHRGRLIDLRGLEPASGAIRRAVPQPGARGRILGRAGNRAGHHRQLQGKHRVDQGQDQEGLVLSGGRDRGGDHRLRRADGLRSAEFKETFVSFGADLPAFTSFVFGISDQMVKWWWLMLLVAGAAVGLFMFLLQAIGPAAALHRPDDAEDPVIGKVLHDSSIARFARTLAVTFKAGVPLVEALDNVAGATGNTVYSKAVLRMKEDVAVGYPVNMAMKQVNLFPHMVVQMTAIGEEPARWTPCCSRSRSSTRKR